MKIRQHFTSFGKWYLHQFEIIWPIAYKSKCFLWFLGDWNLIFKVLGDTCYFPEWMASPTENQVATFFVNHFEKIKRRRHLSSRPKIKLSHKLAFKDALDDYDYSVTRLGYFWKVGVTNFLTKVAQIFSNFMGYLEKCNFTKISLQFGHF